MGALIDGVVDAIALAAKLKFLVPGALSFFSSSFFSVCSVFCPNNPAELAGAVKVLVVVGFWAFSDYGFEKDANEETWGSFFSSSTGFCRGLLKLPVKAYCCY